MNINKTYKSIFWFPNECDNQKYGLLKFSDEIAFVEIFGSFDNDPFNIKTKRRNEICCIYGLIENNWYCILSNCKLSITGGPFGLTSTIISFNYLFYSSNRKLIEEKNQFSKIEFKMNTLFHWGCENSIESFNTDENDFGLKYNEPKEVLPFFCNELYDIKLNHLTSLPLTTYKKVISIEQDTSIILFLKSNQDIHDVFKFIEKIHDLFILFHADKVELNNKFELTTTEKEEHFFCYSNKKRFKKALTNHQYNENENLFTYKDLKILTSLNSVFGLWFEMYDHLSYPIKILTECLSDNGMNSQHRFMHLIYGLEYIHGKDLNNEKANSYYHKKDKELLQEVEGLINEDNRINIQNFLGKLRSRLMNNRKLNDKFKAFFIQLNIPFSEFFNETSEEFTDKIVNTRNNFAHISNKEPRIDLGALDLYNLKLEAILIIIFCDKLGLPITESIRKIKMHHRFQKVIKRIN